MSYGGGPTYFDGLKMSKKQKVFMILLIAGTFLEQMDLYNFAILAPALVKVWGLTTEQVGRIHGAFAIGAVLGCLFFGWLADKKGRKIAMASACIIAGIAAVLSAMAPNLNFLIAVRIVSGFGITGACLVEPSFLIEMVPSDKRSKYQGLLVSIALIGIPLSATLAKIMFAAGPENWRFVAAIPSIALVVGMLFYIMVPESPRWLISNGKVEEGKKVFKYITGQDLKVDPDFECIVDKATYGDAFKVMFSKKYARRTVLFLSIFIFLYNAGFMFMQWLPTLLVKEGMALTQATGYQQMVTLALLLGPVYVMLFGDKGGRKIPYAIATLIVGTGLIGISETGVTNPQLLMIAVLVVGAFYITNQSFSSVYCGECYPTRVRVIIGSLIFLCQRVVNIFSNSFVAPKLYAAAGFSGYFKTLAFIYVAIVILILWLGPRTAGKSLEELNS